MGDRYGIDRNHRFSWQVKLRWPFRSPVTVRRLHRFDMSDDSKTKYHSERCWCRS